ncbi:MAG: MarR family transcriptional regulator [Terriglobia bacterium]|jgi:DNA-binding MarR family transcriptional regulator
MKNPTRAGGDPAIRSDALRQLAWFRYRVRCFLRFSEKVARTCSITPQQHQLLLGVAGYTGRGWATISELAEFLQERHNAVVGLVQRAAERGLVRKIPGQRDRRFVKVHLTRRGVTILEKVSRVNIAELRELQLDILNSPQSRPPDIPAAQGT